MKALFKHIPCAPSLISSTVSMILWSSPVLCHAQDVTPQIEVQSTFGKKIYQNVKLVSVTANGVKILHDAGITVVPASALPKEWLAKYAPDAAAMQPATKEEPKTSGTPKADVPPTVAGTSTTSFDPSSLVFIKTDSASGSGFVAKANGKTYVYTNAHVICGAVGGFTSKIVSIKTASGRTIPTPFEVELSDVKDLTSDNGLEDLARFPITLQEGESAYEISELDPNTAMNSRVIAYGNSLGGDVFTSLDGLILGLGNDRIEVSCEIVPGNSGGPVVLEQTKKVIGVSTYLTSGRRDIWAKATQFDLVRRFAMRPEKVTKWRRMLYTSLMSSTSELNGFDRDTLSLAAACFLNPKPNNAGFDVNVHSKGDYIVRSVLVDGAKYSLGQTINASLAKVNQRLGGGMGGNTARMAVQGVVVHFAEFFNTVSSASSSQMLSLQNADRAPYLKKLIPELIRERTEVHKAFVEQAARFR
jgi:S1-C subfamily serine protease